MADRGTIDVTGTLQSTAAFVGHQPATMFYEYPVRDSNPCYQVENLAS